MFVGFTEEEEDYTMRRNAVTVLKYLVFAAFFLTLGPVLVKLMFGDHNDHVIGVRVAPHGLPVDPEDFGGIGVVGFSLDCSKVMLLCPRVEFRCGNHILLFSP